MAGAEGTNPDIRPVGFAATDGPSAPLRRRRHPAWLVAAVVLLLLGIGALALGVVRAFGPGRDVDGKAVAEGEAAGLGAPATPAVTFTAAEDGRYTVWLDTDGVSEENNRETVVAATNCTATTSDGESARFRGAVQGDSVTVGDRSTVGTFVAPAGEVSVRCHLEPFGRRRRYDRLRPDRRFLVVPGGPGSGMAAFALIFGGTAALAGGAVAGARWRAGDVRRA